jgi:hypothetical protein
MSTWQAVVVEGQELNLRAFVAGFTGERGVDPASVVFGDDVGLDAGSIGEWLLELVGQGHHVVLAPEALGAALAAAIRQIGEDVGLRVERAYDIESASFEVRVETFSHEVSTAVCTALDTLPAGVRVDDRQEHEESTGEPHRVELYAPVHEYSYRVSRRVTGPLQACSRCDAVSGRSRRPPWSRCTWTTWRPGDPPLEQTHAVNLGYLAR